MMTRYMWLWLAKTYGCLYCRVRIPLAGGRRDWTYTRHGIYGEGWHL